ncbi:MAG: hypothetical protein V3R64_05935 [Sphingomonadales bacterium]
MDDEQPKGIELWFGKPLAMLMFFIGLPWAILTLMDQGILMGEETFTGSFGDKSIRCTYLIGAHTVTQTHMTFHVPNCPLIVTILD